MANIAKPNTFSANTTISSSQVNDNFDTIYDEFNGNISEANLADNAVTEDKVASNAVTTPKIADTAVTYTKLISTIFSEQVTSNSNPGTAGGTRNYINLGGIKLCWGITNSITRSGVGGETRGITLPTSFFSSVTGLASNYQSSADERNTAKIQTFSTSALTVHIYNYSGGTGGVSNVSWFVIGT